MSGLLKWVLFIIIAYYIYNWFIGSSSKSKQRKTAQEDKEVRVFKTKETEKPKYNIDAETVEYEEIKENEAENK